MKKHMKKMTAALMAVAMLFSLAVSVSATNITTLTDTGDSQTATNAITNQGGLPADVVNVMMPTATANAFSMLFDSHQLIKASGSSAFTQVPGNGSVYVGANGKGTAPVFEANSRFFFKNTTETATTAFIAFSADTTIGSGSDAVTIPANSTADVYVPKTVKKVYYNPDGTESNGKWYNDQDALVTYSGEFADIVSIKNIDFDKAGEAADLLQNLNETKLISFARNGTEVGANTATNIKGLAEYTFNYYDQTAASKRYVVTVGDTTLVLKDKNGGGYEADSTITDVATLTNDTNHYDKLPVNLNVVSYSSTSDKVTVTNKSNLTIGVSMSAELTGIPGGDGSDTDEDGNADSVVYAASMSSGDFLNDSGDKIEDVPVFYFAMQDGTAADTTAMTYADSKGTVKIDTKLAGHPEFFDTKWNGSAYYYDLKPAIRSNQFNSIDFTLTGQINEDDGWDAIIDSGAALSVTWTVKTYKPTLTEPTLTAGTLNVTKAWPVTVSGNKDNATITSVKAYTAANAGGTESNVTYTVTETGFTVPKNFFTTAPASIKVTFKGPADNEDLKNLTVDVVYDLD